MTTDFDHTGLPKVTNIRPMPDVKPPKDIDEEAKIMEQLSKEIIAEITEEFNEKIPELGASLHQVFLLSVESELESMPERWYHRFFKFEPSKTYHPIFKPSYTVTRSDLIKRQLELEENIKENDENTLYQRTGST